jgi:hypothetical protein
MILELERLNGRIGDWRSRRYDPHCLDMLGYSSGQPATKPHGKMSTAAKVDTSK